MLALLFALAAPGIRAADAWIQCDSPGVRVLSDASAREVTEFTVQYGAFRHTLIQFFRPEGAALPPTTIVLFRRHSDLVRWAARPGEDRILSASVEVDHTTILATASGAYSRDTLSTLFEYDTEQTLPRLGYALPLWMRQGTGEVFASVSLYKGRCTLGEPEDRFTVPLRSEWLPWSRFYAVGYTSPEYKGTVNSGVYQSQAWVLMHEVLLAGDGRARFEDLIKRLGTTWDEKPALEAVLGRPESLFDVGLNSHLGSFRPRTMPFDEAGFRAALKLSPVPEAEVAVRFADLLLAADKAAAADAQIDRAAALAPANPLVQEAQARRELRRNNNAGAVEFYSAAIKAGSTDPDAFAFCATDLMNQSETGNSDYAGDCRMDGDVVLQDVRRAIALDPGEIYYRELLGRAFFVVPNVSANDVAELSQAISDDPAGLEVRYYRGLLYARLQRVDECRADVAYVAQNKATSAFRRRWAQTYLAGLDYDSDRLKVNAMVKDQQFAEAKALLQQRTDAGIEQSMRPRYESLQQYVAESEDWHTVVNRLQRRDWRTAAEAAASFLEKYPRSANRRQIERWQQLAEAQMARQGPGADGAGP